MIAIIRHERNKDGKMVVHAFGEVNKGGLGEFDPDVYLEIDHFNPEVDSYVMESTTFEGIARLSAFLFASPQTRLPYAKLTAQVSALLLAGYKEDAYAVLDQLIDRETFNELLL